jgi:hypothetical protein
MTMGGRDDAALSKEKRQQQENQAEPTHGTLRRGGR